MRISTGLSVLLTYTIATAAIPVFQLEMEDGSEPSDALKTARDGVQRQIPKMLLSLQQAENDDPAALDRLVMAFGSDGINQISRIRDNIQRIDAGTMKISTLAPKEVDKKWKQQIAAVAPHDYRGSTNEAVRTYPVELGTMWNDREPADKMDTSTILHEAAHVFAHASDNHHLGDRRTPAGDIIPFGFNPDSLPGGGIGQKNGGYANEDPVVSVGGAPITDAQLHPHFKDLRESAGNMYMNADSYALFGASCDAEMARLRKRALMEGDHLAYYLAKRDGGACRLPPDYFKKKAEAKAAKEKAAAANGPASKTPVVKQKSKSIVGTASKGTPKALGKTAKSKLLKTSRFALAKGSLKGSKAKIANTRSSKASPRGKLSKSQTPKLSSKIPKSSRTKVSKGKSSKAVSKSIRTKISSKKPSKAVSKKAGRLATSKAKTSRPLSGSSITKTLKAKTPMYKNISKSSKPEVDLKAGSPKPVSKSSESTRITSGATSISQVSSNKAVKSIASPAFKAVLKKGTKP